MSLKDKMTEQANDMSENELVLLLSQKIMDYVDNPTEENFMKLSVCCCTVTIKQSINWDGRDNYDKKMELLEKARDLLMPNKN